MLSMYGRKESRRPNVADTLCTSTAAFSRSLQCPFLFELCGAKIFCAEAAVLLFIQTCPCNYSKYVELAKSILASCKSFVRLEASLMAQGILSPLDVCFSPELPMPEKASSGRKPAYSIFKIASYKSGNQSLTLGQQPSHNPSGIFLL